jgi:hypothetical protein
MGWLADAAYHLFFAAYKPLFAAYFPSVESPKPDCYIDSGKERLLWIRLLR